MKSGVTLQQMLTEVKRQSESKEDYLIAPNRLRMESYGKEMFLHLSDDSGTELIEPMTITGIAHRQIGTHLRIPAAYYDRMREERPDLLAYNANTWFKQESSQRMLRTLDGSARAYLSKGRFVRADDITAAIAVNQFDLIQRRMLGIGFHVGLRVRAMVPTVAHNHADGIAARAKQRQNIIGLVAEVLFIHGMLRCKDTGVGCFAVQIDFIGTVTGSIEPCGDDFPVHGKRLTEQCCRASVAKALFAWLGLFLRCDPLCCPLICGQQRRFKPAALLGRVSVVVLH